MRLYLLGWLVILPGFVFIVGLAVFGYVLKALFEGRWPWRL